MKIRVPLVVSTHLEKGEVNMKKLLILLIVLSTLCGSLVTTAVPTRVQADADGNNSETAYLMVAQPTLWLRPDVGAVGDWVKISGINWVPNEMVTVTFDGTQFLVMSDSTGALNSPIQVPPPSAHGNTAVTAQDNQGNSATDTFTKGNFTVYEYGHFAIHYTADDDDIDCVRDTDDSHDTNGNFVPGGNGYPDCVDMVAKEAELSWHAIIDEFGYMPPTMSSWLNKFHIYIYREGSCSNSDGPGVDPGEGFIRFPVNLTEEWYVNGYYTDPSSYHPRTCFAHELYHRIQAKYYLMAPQTAASCTTLPPWISEGSAVWMSQEVVGNYTPPVVPWWGPDYLAQTYKGLDPAPTDCMGYFWNEGSQFFYFLADNSQINFTGTGTQRDIMRMYWEEVGVHGLLDNKQNFDHALSNAPEGYNSFYGAFMAFVRANYFHDDWYPKWVSGQEVTTNPVDLKTSGYVDVHSYSDGLNPLNHYGSEYFKIEAYDGQYVRIKFTGDDPLAHFFLLVYPGGYQNQECSPILTNGQGEVTVKASNTVLIVGRLDDQLPSEGVGHFGIELTVQPSVTITSPTSKRGPVGTGIVVAGDGFSANSVVDVSIGGEHLAYANTDVRGSFVASAELPTDLSIGYNVVSATAGEDITAVVTDNFFVTSAPPTVTSVRPIWAYAGRTLIVTVTGTNLIGPDLVDFGPGISVSLPWQPALLESFYVSITIDDNATPGPRDVSVTTPYGQATLPGGFWVGLPPLVIKGFSPIDLSIEDPDGLIINKQASLIPDATYVEQDLDNDGDLDDLVTVPYPKEGDYQIVVLPEPGAQPTDKYTLEVSRGDAPTTLAQDVAIGKIPADGYLVRATETSIQAAPVANGGSDEIVERTSAAGAQVTLDGSGSYDPDSGPQPLSYTWTWAGGSAIGVSPTVTMPMGTTEVTLEVSDGELADTDEMYITVEDTTPPTVTVEFPTADLAVQDGVTLKASASDLSGVAAVYFYVREPDGSQGKVISSEFEDLAATLNSGTGKWEYNFDTLQLPDGYYCVLAKALDTYGNSGWSAVVPFNIRNWAVIQMLPSTPNSNAGRTMPVKFAIMVAASVDPAQPFVYNDDLTIKIFATSNPGNILQTSTFGSGSTNYRIADGGRQYITDFKTLKTPMQYTVEIYKDTFLVGSFTFKTVK